MICNFCTEDRDDCVAFCGGLEICPDCWKRETETEPVPENYNNRDLRDLVKANAN